MKNYTTAEIQEMQKQAIERVREMHRRSQLTKQNVPIDMDAAASEHKRTQSKEAEQATPRLPDTPKRISMPANLPGTKSRGDESIEYNYARAQNDGPPTIIRDDDRNHKKDPEFDSEKALLLALVLLLSGEGADLELILALLYIMF